MSMSVGIQLTHGSKHTTPVLRFLRYFANRLFRHNS